MLNLILMNTVHKYYTILMSSVQEKSVHTPLFFVLLKESGLLQSIKNIQYQDVDWWKAKTGLRAVHLPAELATDI